MSTTVDETLLASARSALSTFTDAALLDAALAALMDRHRASEIDAAYTVYDEHPLGEPRCLGRSGLIPGGGSSVVSVSPLPARGEVWWCELPDIGRRPVVVLSRDAAIPRLRRTLVAPCTTTIRGLASEVVVEPADDPVPQRSSINLDSVESVSVAVLVERLGRLSDDRMREVCVALDVAVDCGG